MKYLILLLLFPAIAFAAPRSEPTISVREEMLQRGRLNLFITVTGQGNVKLKGDVLYRENDEQRWNKKPLSSKSFALSDDGETKETRYEVRLPVDTVSWKWNLQAVNINR